MAGAGVTTSGGWVGLVASAPGRTHPKGVTNQDAALVAQVRTADGLVAAVADGHGGRRHVRSHLGSRFAAELAVHLVLERGTNLPRMTTSLVDRWRGAAREHAALNPFTRAERAAAGVDLDADPVLAYGSTLLLAVVRGDRVELAQLGDGDVVVLGPDGPARPVPPDPRLVANETTSLCLPGAVTDVRFAGPIGGRLVLLATDGMGNAQRGSDWWPALLAECERLAAQGLDQLTEGLADRVEESARAGGDDATVALLLRSPDGG